MNHPLKASLVLTASVGSFLVAGLASAAKPAADRLAYKEVVAPLLRAKCYECHAGAEDNPDGKAKIKAELELTSLETIKKGGDTDAAAVAGDPEHSLMIERIKLPLEDDEHMPPKEKAQIEEHELKVLEWWIKAEFPVDKSLKDAGAPSDVIAAAELVKSEEEVKQNQAASAAAAAAKAAESAAARKALEGAIAEVSQHFPNAVGFVSQQDSDLTFTAVSMRKDFTDEDLAKLAPVSEGLVDVNLGATSITDSGAGHLAKMPNLRKLWLNGTSVTDNGLDAIKDLEDLEYLNLYGTEITDEGLKKLAGLKNLKKLYLWQTKVTKEGADAFKQSVPDCDVNLGISVQ